MFDPTVEICIQQLKSRYNVIDVVTCDDMLDVDLYVKIKGLYRESFDANDRVVFVITQDLHDADGPGLMLQTLQALINDIDISNFFVTVVTTNPDIRAHYKNVLDTISTDPVPFNIKYCEGSYKKIPSRQKLTQKKYHDIGSHAQEIQSLTAEQKKLLFDNDAFCMMPWVGIYIGPNSQVRPCCVSRLDAGDASKNSLEEIWNHSVMRSVRQQMMQRKKVSSCQDCYVMESMGRHSLRQTINKKFVAQISSVTSTAKDGHFPEFNLRYWDIRYNNLCNLSCRSCDPISSSSWHRAAVYLGYKDLPAKAIHIAGKKDQDIFQQMMQHIDSVESIYFAGGEPLMIEEFYVILEKLLERGRRDVKLIYNTNLTLTGLKSKNIFDLWREFSSVSVGASLDGEYRRGEYLREGTKWSDVLSNRQKMMAECPHVDFYITATTSLLNALHIPDFHRSWVESNLIKPGDFNIQLLFQPKWMCVSNAPEELKERIRNRYTKHLDWLESRDDLGRASYGFRSLLELMDTDGVFDSKEFWRQVEPLDQLYRKNLLEIFPELSTLPRN